MTEAATIGVLRSLVKFTRKHLCQSLFLIKLQAFPENTFFTEHSGWLFLLRISFALIEILLLFNVWLSYSVALIRRDLWFKMSFWMSMCDEISWYSSNCCIAGYFVLFSFWLIKYQQKQSPGGVLYKKSVLNFFFYLGFLSRTFTIHGTAGKGGGYLFPPLYYFHPLHRHLDVRRPITAESAPLHIASSPTRTENFWFPSASC